MLQVKREPLLRIDYHKLPKPVIRLAEYLDKHTRNTTPFSVQNLPAALRQADVLDVAQIEFVVRVLAHRFPDRLDLQAITFGDASWHLYTRAGVPLDLREALQRDREITDRRRGLFVRLTLQAIAGLPFYRLAKMDGDRPDDLMRLVVAAKLVHAVPKTLRDAISEGLLRDYRQPGHAKNTPMLVSRSEVLKLWLDRA